MYTYQNLIVWQKAIELSFQIYKLTENFPKNEQFGLTSQMRRSAVSIPSNIAEGRLRGSTKEFRRFLLIAFGSGGELETQLLLALRLGFIEEKDTRYTESKVLLSETMKILNALIKKLRTTSP